MSSNTTLRTNIIFPHKTYDSKWKVEEELEDAKQCRQNILWDLLRKNTSLEPFELNQLTADLEDIDVQIWQLHRLLSEWDKLIDKETGELITSPGEYQPKIWGDFINVHTVDDLDLK